jgi:hypothetical protein
VLYSQLEDLHQNYLTTKNAKLQKLKLDIEKESNELDHIDPKNWNTADRLRLSQYWIDLQRKLDDQTIDFTYKSSSTHPSHLGDIRLKTPNQENEYLQRQKLNIFDTQDTFISSTVNLQNLF